MPSEAAAASVFYKIRQMSAASVTCLVRPGVGFRPHRNLIFVWGLEAAVSAALGRLGASIRARKML